MDEENKINIENEAIAEEAVDNEAEENAQVQDAPADDLQSQLEAAQAQAKESFDKYLRQVAEFDNYRKRTTAEKASMYSNGVRDTVEKLLPIMDNFERAVASSQETDDALYTGVTMILKQMQEMLASLGVEEIEAQGEPFDPNFHNAVMHIDDESCDTNVVVEVFQKGYKMGDKVIRHSMVKVAN